MSGVEREAAGVEGTGSGSIGRGVADLAARQWGVVHRDQLVRLGAERSRIARWVSAGRLHPLLPRVFAVGHPTLPVGGREMAALLWRGPDSALSHASAAWALGFGPTPPVVHVSSAVGGTASRPRVRTHRLLRLDPVDVGHRRGLRLTAGPRTLIDLADTEPASELERLVAEARYRRLVSDDQLRDAVRRHPNRRGASVLTSILDTEKEPAFTRSKGERELRRILRRAGLAFPRTNVRLGGYEVDAFWPDARLVVEVDGYEAHRGRQAFERDRRKAASLETAGYRVLRVSWRQIKDTPESVAAVVAAALASAR